MGWDNPPVPWREFERRLSWGKGTAKSRQRGGRPAEGMARAGSARLVRRLASR